MRSVGRNGNRIDELLAQGSFSLMAPKQKVFQSLRAVTWLPFIVLVICAPAADLLAADNASVGSAQFRPSPAQPIGWRGDGSGRYPGATGPVSWERKPAADGYTTKGILWMTP
ncbi:MAG TPA: hypothetical protein VMZ27_08115, partial [Candidatus Saccharimonadales bacterium]|nr:hypothetical protein [Candidatus Saccharimonadales bacterium]